MKLLAIETATEACSAALSLDGEVTELYRHAPREHASLILSMAGELLAEAGLTAGQLDAVAFGRGPGGFTGVRIATSVIQGIAFAADLPVVPVSTLAALAHGACREQGEKRILAAIDARMAEVYWGAYEIDASGLLLLRGVEQVAIPEQVAVPEAGEWFGVGSGWRSYGDILQRRVGRRLRGVVEERYPRARDVACLAVQALQRGESVNPEQALPVYLRDNVAKAKGSR